jgi:5-methyltetrahydropteroyltriglutamate--homocysteine methyltransferase
MSKISYTNYMKHRLSGFEGAAPVPFTPEDLDAFPAMAETIPGGSPSSSLRIPACVGPIAVKDRAPLLSDIDNFHDAVAAAKPHRAFMNAASPGVIAMSMPNRYYEDEDEYVWALADALKDEYDSIISAGFDLQVDAPDLAMGRHTLYKTLSLEAFRRNAARNVEALNHATRDIAPGRMRIHLCWGNYPGPHTHDVPVADVIDIVLKARPNVILFEAANPRHGYEHAVWEANKALIPDDKFLVPGVIDTNTNGVEHPELVAERLRNYIRIVGPERVMAGTDCGFATIATRPRVHPDLVWEKLKSQRAGADIAAARA